MVKFEKDYGEDDIVDIDEAPSNELDQNRQEDDNNVT
jgi:hypothetical protein